MEQHRYTGKWWVDYVIFGLSVFLVFCLFFEAYIEPPNLVAWIGRWHPLILHFPIVLLLIAIFLGLTGKKVPHPLLYVAVISALVTAISGFFLGKETGSKGDLLLWHQWLGGALALLAAIWYGLQGMGFGNQIWVKGLQVVIVGLVVFTGHYGGMVTHGEDFLALPGDGNKEEIPEDPLVYAHVVHPILENNCVQCHNPNKQKGEFLMTDILGLLKGGKRGNTLVPGEPGKSELIRRLHLPMEDKEHMPPEGERPLNLDEIQILERWIALGASDTLKLSHLGRSEPLVALIQEIRRPDPLEKWQSLPRVADTTLLNLASDYLSITRIASTTDALKVNLYNPPEYDAKMVLDLGPVQQNIIELDLSGLPIGQVELSFVANCNNLEWLELDQTPLTDVEVDTLRNLRKVRLLKIFNTEIGENSLSVFESWEDLNSLYLWNTQIPLAALDEFGRRNPNILMNTGIDEQIKSYFSTLDSIQ